MFTIRIAELNICINNKYHGVERLCRDYMTACAKPDLTVSATDEEIAAEIEISPYSASPGYSESICIYRHICERLYEYDAFLLHSAVVECDGKAYAFAAASGTGKSTHAALWLEQFGERARIINGDKPIIRFIGDRAYIFGTPWCGKEGYNVNASSPLYALCFIERAEENSIRPSCSSETVKRLFNQILIPHDGEAVIKLTSLLDRLVRRIPCFILSCNISTEAARVAYEGMSGYSGGVVGNE